MRTFGSAAALCCCAVIVSSCTSTSSGEVGRTQSTQPRPSRSSTAPAIAPPMVQIFCEAETPGGVAPPRESVVAIRDSLQTRLAETLEPRAVSVEMSGDASLQVRIAGDLPVDADAVCRFAGLEIRALVAPGQLVTCRTTDHSCSATAIDQLQMPESNDAFEHLSPAAKHSISAALAGFDCSSTVMELQAGHPWLVACDKPSSNRLSYLLGPVVVPGIQVTDAQAMPPDPSNGDFSWFVSLSLSGLGADSLGKYTAAHNTGRQEPAVSASSCSPTTTPCSDFIAYLLDGTVLIATYVKDRIGAGPIQLDNLTKAEAQTLADEIMAGALGTSLHVAQAQVIH